MTKSSPSLLNQILDLTCTIQQIPSPTFSESEKAAFVAEQFQRDGLQDVTTDSAGNVLARLPGGPGRPVVVTAHMDTVHPTHVRLTQIRGAEQIHGPSIGDNSLGVATLVCLPALIRELGIQPAGDVWLAANTGEEGLGDLRGMRAVVDQFGAQPRAYLVLEGMGLGQVYHRGLGVERYRITARTRGGHSWVDYGKPSAVHHLAGVVTQLARLTLPRTPRTTLNVGTFAGGTSINTIAAEAHLDLDLRSEDSQGLQGVANAVRQIVDDARRDGVTYKIEPIGLRPAGEIPASHPLVRLAEQSLRDEGVTPRLEIASTDANIPLARAYAAVCIGLTTGGGAHTTSEFIDIQPLQQGIGQLERLVSGVWSVV